jgi:hypothetical protein
MKKRDDRAEIAARIKLIGAIRGGYLSSKMGEPFQTLQEPYINTRALDALARLFSIIQTPCIAIDIEYDSSADKINKIYVALNDENEIEQKRKWLSSIKKALSERDVQSKENIF